MRQAPDALRGLFHATRDSTIISIADSSSAEQYWAGSTFMPNKRGNPNWGRPNSPVSILCTEFEMQVRQLHLMPETYTSSAELRTWCERNRNNFYIPEWLLDEWEIRVNADLTGAA